jgi:hypothetical protein
MLAGILAVSGGVLCGLIHAVFLIQAAFSITLAPAVWARLFSISVLAVFPLGGFAILVGLRLGRQHGVRSGLAALIAQRSPRWLRRAGIGVFIYALIYFVAFRASGAQESLGATDVPLVASAFVAWFYLMFLQAFAVGLSDWNLVGSKGRQHGRARI